MKMNKVYRVILHRRGKCSRSVMKRFRMRSSKQHISDLSIFCLKICFIVDVVIF